MALSQLAYFMSQLIYFSLEKKKERQKEESYVVMYYLQ